MRRTSTELYHAGCVWGLTTSYDENKGSAYFATCSSDDTVRMWNLTHQEEDGIANSLWKILYFDPELTALKDSTVSLGGDGKENYDQKTGIRCLNISPDGSHLASGDRVGNIRIHNLNTMQEMCRIEAHDAEVLSLEYSMTYLASTSRDRLIHVFDANKDYEFLNTVDDHSSSITAVKFSEVGGGKMVSCGADKTIIFRGMKTDSDGLSLTRANQIVAKTTLYDMALDVSGENIITACQDRNVRVYGVDDAKLVRVMKGSSSEDGSVVKVVLDRSGTYFATSCTDKCVCVYEYRTGDLVGTLTGHSELVTGLAFSPDCQHLITVSGDSCVFLWKLPGRMIDSMKAQLLVVNPDAEIRCDVYEGDEDALNVENEEFGSPPPELLGLDELEGQLDTEDYRFSVGKLPSWAKVSAVAVMDKSPQSSPIMSLDMKENVPRGKWATRKHAIQFGEDETGDVSTIHKSPRKTLFDETDGLFDGRNDEFKVNAMDIDELRKSVRKQKYRDNLVESVYNHEYLEDDEEVASDDYIQLNNTQNEDIQSEDRQEMFFKSSFASLSSPTDTKVGTLSNAWREGNTPVQLRKHMKTTFSSNSIEDVEEETVRSLSCGTSNETTELNTDSPSPVNSAQGKRSFLQKACSLLDKAGQESPKEHAIKRKVIAEEPKHKRSSSLMSKLGHPKNMLRGSKKVKGDSLKIKKQPVPQHKTTDDIPNYMKPTLAKSKKEKVTVNGDVKINQDDGVVNKMEIIKDAGEGKFEAHCGESLINNTVEATQLDMSREPLSHKLVQVYYLMFILETKWV